MEGEMSVAQNKNSEHGGIIVLVLKMDYRQSYVYRAIPEKGYIEYAACRYPPVEDKHINAGQQPKCGQTNQRLTACRRLVCPSRHGCQQKCNDNQPGIVPNHFMDMSVKTRQLRRFLKAETPK